MLKFNFVPLWCGLTGLPSEYVISQTLTVHAGKDVNEKNTREFIFTFASVLFHGITAYNSTFFLNKKKKILFHIA